MTSPPAWFSAALAVAPQKRTATVEGTSIAYRVWGDQADRIIALVHGGAAHSRWWDHIAPILAHGWQVVALDLSGHGDSGRRASYSLDTWAGEVLAVVTEAGQAASSVVIGHSMGGLVTLRLASLAGSQIAGAVAIDSPIRDVAPEDRAARQHRAFGPLRVYPTREEILTRFRPIPDQPTLSYITEHVAATSVRPAEGGWTWKFDPHVFTRDHLTAELLTRLDCRVALFRAEHGLVTPQQGEVLYDRLGRVAPLIEIPVAGHHIMLDQPVALAAALRTLLADWDHSIPHGHDLRARARTGSGAGDPTRGARVQSGDA
jgi:pimeloyl-ACP methyl ester carboxylesterase